MGRIKDSSPPGKGLAAHGWSSEQLVTLAGEYYETLLLDIDRANHRVELSVYIFALDDVGRPIVDALLRAAGRGVEVRVTVDGVGSAADAELIARELFAAGAKLKIFHPLPWYWGNYRWSIKPGTPLEKFYYFIAGLNRRDHRKFCVIDSAVAWCGSFNICCDHVDLANPWRDYAVRLTGGAVSHLANNFEAVWSGQLQAVEALSLHYSRTNISRRSRRFRNSLLAHRICHAQQRAWICNAYFSPSGAVIRAIKAARKRQVDVRLIVAGRSDVALFPLLSSTYYADLLKLGVKIYRYQAGILHAKLMLVDGECVVGSTNLNHRSFYHDLELDVVLSAENTIALTASSLQQDMQFSRQLILADMPRFSHTLLFGWLLRLIRYWL